MLAAEAILVRASPNGAMVLVGCAERRGGLFPGGFGRRVQTPDLQALRRRGSAADGFPLRRRLGGPHRRGRPAGTMESCSARTRRASGLFGQTKVFPKLGEGPVIFAASQRNRTFLTGTGRDLIDPPQHLRRGPLGRARSTSIRSSPCSMPRASISSSPRRTATRAATPCTIRIRTRAGARFSARSGMRAAGSRSISGSPPAARMISSRSSR